MKSEILTYQRIGNVVRNLGKAKEKNFFYELFLKENALILITAFLLGRASLIGSVMPFGMTLYAAAYGHELNKVLLTIFIILGMVTGGAREHLYVTLSAMLLFYVFMIPFKKYRSGVHFIRASVAFISVLIPEIIIVYLQGFLIYDLLKALFHSFIVFTLTVIFCNAAPVIIDRKKSYLLSNEEIISLAIVAAIAISGLASINLIGFEIKNVLCILLILVFSNRCGAGVGAAIGVTVGLIVNMSSLTTPLAVGSYAFCGLLSGIFKSLGKFGSGLGFIMGNAVLTLYLNGSTETIIYLKEIILAVIIFLLLPQRVLDVVVSKFNRSPIIEGDRKSYSKRIKDMTVEKLNKFSNALQELAKTFSEISETKVVTDKQDISSLFDRVADKVCKDCSLCLHCWDRNFYNTYQVMFKIIEKLDAKGWIEARDIPGYFMDRCERLEDFVKAVNNMYELFKVDMVWKSKIGESRDLVSQQLGGLSKVISNLADEIDTDIRFKNELEDVIATELEKVEIKVNEVIVYENKWGKYEINVLHKGCGGKRSCISIIEKLVSEAVGRKMVKENNECSMDYRGSNCNMKLAEEETFRVTTGVAMAVKHNSKLSGDSYTFMNNGDGKFIVALSDGMGSGQRAATQSRATINMLEQFMETGFDKDTAVKMINSVLVLKSSDDSFATIDLSVIDLYDGNVEFVKFGAVPTFIKKEDRVEVVRSASIPAGILSNIEMELISKKLENGNFIIMMSDGIHDSFKKDEDRDISVRDFINKIESTNPQEIADIILDKAYKNSDKGPADDMMVVVAKVWKRVS